MGSRGPSPFAMHGPCETNEDGGAWVLVRAVGSGLLAEAEKYTFPAVWGGHGSRPAEVRTPVEPPILPSMPIFSRLLDSVLEHRRKACTDSDHVNQGWINRRTEAMQPPAAARIPRTAGVARGEEAERMVREGGAGMGRHPTGPPPVTWRNRHRGSTAASTGIHCRGPTGRGSGTAAWHLPLLMPQ